MKTDVFISGGGIGGLCLALKLAKNGVDVTVAERLPGPSPIYKGELLQPKSLEIFSDLQVLNQIMDHGHKIENLQLQELNSQYKRLNESILYYTHLPSDTPYAVMIHHEKLKELIRKRAGNFPNFHYLKGTVCERIEGQTAYVKNRETKKESMIESTFIIGAEGRTSVTRDRMGITVEEETYNHHFLTVTFPRPDSLTEGKIISNDHAFLGLFPLPDNQVRSVYLIPAGEFKKLRKEPISTFHQLYINMCPELDGYVQHIESWKPIQLMVPQRYHIDTYTQNHLALLGDAAHTVHPMAGEGMNMAIQDADVLGELLSDMFKQERLSTVNLEWFPKVRRSRVTYQLFISHLSALAYSYPYKTIRWLRGNGVKRMEKDPILHFKQMLNVSGLGVWKETIVDRMVMAGLLPLRDENATSNKREKRFTREEDYPWKVGRGTLQ